MALNPAPRLLTALLYFPQLKKGILIHVLNYRYSKYIILDIRQATEYGRTGVATSIKWQLFDFSVISYLYYLWPSVSVLIYSTKFR